MTDFLSSEFWNQRYSDEKTGWDIGEISRPIREYFDQVPNKDAAILIPGCGNGHEAEYLFHQGFTNVTVLDFAELPLKHLKMRVPNYPDEHIMQGDFFTHHGQYDYIVEQTLFCAIDPSLRENYVEKIKELLNPGGRFVGVLFDRKFESGPPFGGCKEEYMNYFTKYFSNVSIEPCYNSIEPRIGSEVFVIVRN